MQKFSSLNHLLQHYAEDLSLAPVVNARSSKQKERIFQSFQIENPTRINITIPERKFNAEYGIAEWLWYLAAERSSSNIGKLAKIWKMISDEHGEVESNYGTYLISQWDWIKKEIINDRDTRRATVVINQVHHKYKNMKDYPCTHYIQFFVRDNKLHLGVNMRSNDLIFGLCNDVFTFSLFQQLMLNELNSNGLDLKLGNYFHHAGSLHVYEKHFAMVEKIKNSDFSIDIAAETCKLNDKVSWESISRDFPFPVAESEKSEIYDYVNRVTKEIID
mgnify:CR=1 FL=1|tara:strand:- start:3 stop:827 length:825 start_codon:yes stop_codon:yes gene_type:complete